jgi:hypothetical protein
MTRARINIPVPKAEAPAHIIQHRQTCEGCSHLRAFRPMCQAETSPYYRQPRHTGSDACSTYAVKGHQVTKPAAPEPTPASRAEIGGEVSRRKHNRWARNAPA